MRSFIHFTITLIVLSCLSHVAFGDSSEGTEKNVQDQNSRDWGYIRIDNLSSKHKLATKCYNKYGKGKGRWKTVHPSFHVGDQFRSCRGAYMRVDVFPSHSTRKLFTQRIWRDAYECNTGRLYIKFYNQRKDKLLATCDTDV